MHWSVGVSVDNVASDGLLVHQADGGHCRWRHHSY